MRIRLLALAAWVAAGLAAPAMADAPPPDRIIALAKEPGIVDRFLAAALDGPVYYNFMQLPVDPGRLSRIADDQPMDYFSWVDMMADEPLVIARVRELTGLPESSLDSTADNEPLIVYEEKPALDTPRPQLSIDPPFYVADAGAVPDAACGAFVMSMNPLKPREIVFMTIRMVEGTPDPQRQRCLSLMILRSLGLAGLPEVASGLPIPGDVDRETMLTAEEELFLWLAYRIPVGADRDAVRKAAVEHLAALADTTVPRNWPLP